MRRDEIQALAESPEKAGGKTMTFPLMPSQIKAIAEMDKRVALKRRQLAAQVEAKLPQLDLAQLQGELRAMLPNREAIERLIVEHGHTEYFEDFLNAWSDLPAAKEDTEL